MTEPRVLPTPRLPSEAHMRHWIEELVAQGIRRPGYPADHWAEEFVFRTFEAHGLEAVRFEPVEAAFWRDSHGRLSVSGQSRSEFECFPVPFSEPTRVTGPLARWDPGDPGAVAGKVALYELRFGSLPYDFPVVARRAPREGRPTSPDALVRSGWVFDPDDTFAHGGHRLPFAAEMQETMEPAIAAGAIGFIGVLRGYPSGDCAYYVPYDGRFRKIPGVYVSEREGDRLVSLMDEGPVEAQLEVAAERGTTSTRNVVGELPGSDEEWVVVGTHHDAPWASAVEDGTGIAMLLAQAKAWSAVPKAQRPHRLVFAAMAAHMAHAAGTQAFLERHRAMLDHIVLEVHLEHAALDKPSQPGETDGKLAPVTPRWWFTTENPLLERIVWDAIVEHTLDRSLVLTPDALGPMPTTDGGFFHLAGVPLVNYLTAPWYLFDPADTLEMVDHASLSNVSLAAFDIMRATAGVSARQLRL